MIRVKRLAALCLVLAVLLGVLPMEARAATNEEGIPVKPEAATLSEQPVLKILCIGNSDLYYNDLGGYIAAFGHKTEHKMIVVHAVHAGWGPRALMSGEISAYAWYATGKTVSARCDDIYNYDTTLDDVLDKDWGNLGREGEWDYIIFLNDPTREGGLSRLADGDSRMFHYVKDRLTAPENFIVLGYHWGDSNGAKANIEHKKAAAQDHFSVLVTGEYFSKVNRQWQNYFTIQDRWRHPSARAQYFNACSVYARLFGRENLASSEISAELIGLYNRKNGTSREFYRTIFARDSDVNDKAQNIDINAARKIQSTIYQNYDGVMGLQVASTQTELLELDAPELESALADGGIQIAWNQIDGAAKYRLFYRIGNSKWKKIADTAAETYVWKKAESGIRYTFTARCIDADNRYISSYSKQGTSIYYIAAPVISKVENRNGSIKVTWPKSAGAAGYRVFRKIGSGKWEPIADTTKRSIVDRTIKPGVKYTYTVQCLDRDGQLMGAFHSKGKSIRYIAPPVLSKVQNVKKGVKVTWQKSAGAVKYRVFRKTGNGKWQKVGDTAKLTFVDKHVKKGVKYSYTVRCISKNGKSYTSAYNTKGMTIKRR